MSQVESAAMLRNVIFKLKETKTHAEIMGWLIAEAVVILKDLSFSEPEIKQAQAKPATIQDTNNATGPRGEAWKPPVGGWYRHDGRFVKDETWKPAEKPVEQERKPSVPDVLNSQPQGPGVSTALNLNHPDGRVRDANATGGAFAVEWTPPVRNGQGHYEKYGPNGEGSRWVPDPEPEERN